jgi:hypothetical protein
MIEENSSRAFRLIAACLLALSLGRGAEAGGQTNVSKNEAIDVAREYIQKNLPEEARVLKYQTFAVDRGETWVVTFMPPGEPRTGGVPEVYVDKTSLKVIKVERAQ